jgi:hypothetical protein
MSLPGDVVSLLGDIAAAIHNRILAKTVSRNLP